MGNEKLENVYRILYRENGLQMLWMLQNKKGKLNIFIERYHEDKVRYDDKGENYANKDKRTFKDRVSFICFLNVHFCTLLTFFTLFSLCNCPLNLYDFFCSFLSFSFYFWFALYVLILILLFSL
jgi:hypothetical protein